MGKKMVIFVGEQSLLPNLSKYNKVLRGNGFETSRFHTVPEAMIAVETAIKIDPDITIIVVIHDTTGAYIEPVKKVDLKFSVIYWDPHDLIKAPNRRNITPIFGEKKPAEILKIVGTVLDRQKLVKTLK